MLIAAGAIGSFAATGGNPTIKSEDYTAWFYLNHLQVHLLENGKDVCGGENTLDGASKASFLDSWDTRMESLARLNRECFTKKNLAQGTGRTFPST